ncbi:MAG: exodeoxyribonuclease V subunit alpha [Cocleimonas sp.]
MSEQLSMDLFSDNPPPMEEAKEKIYEALDHQLSDLMHELNGDKLSDKPSGKKNKTLKHCTLEISQHTREGQIALECTPAQKIELLKTHVVGEAGDYKPLILEDGYLYLRRYWQYQQQLADQIKSRLVVDEVDEEWAQQRLEYYFASEKGSEEGSEEGCEEVNWQKVSAERALQNRFLIVSGGPGTGKTTTITKILALLIEFNLVKKEGVKQEAKGKSGISGGGALLNSNLRILLAAPTGKASIRMLDAISEVQGTLNLSDAVQAQMPKQASTIHKLLGFIPEKVSFKHNRNTPLNADVVLIDEASMIDIAMMSKLIEAVPAHAKLILIGDKDQLSSVETGSVFADMCEGLSNKMPHKNDSPLYASVKRGGGLGRGEKPSQAEEAQINPTHIVTLQKNYRFKKQSNIGQLSISANKGDSKTLLNLLKDQSKPDCNLLAPNIITGKQIPKNLTAPWDNYFKTLSNPNASITEIFQAFNQYRVLCALRRGLNGSTTLSTRIETALAKQGLIKMRGNFGQQSQNWYHGRPVMITQNSYSKGLFNGDTGITLKRDGETKVYFPDDSLLAEGSLLADGSNAFKSLAPVRLPAHETTWAMTIHKSQGSEFDQVTLILPHEVMPLLTRQLIYTGITRAKEQVNIVASEAVLNAGVKTEMVRATRMGDKL